MIMSCDLKITFSPLSASSRPPGNHHAIHAFPSSSESSPIRLFEPSCNRLCDHHCLSSLGTSTQPARGSVSILEEAMQRIEETQRLKGRRPNLNQQRSLMLAEETVRFYQVSSVATHAVRILRTLPALTPDGIRCSTALWGSVKRKDLHIFFTSICMHLGLL